jgi:hypothetical protein
MKGSSVAGRFFRPQTALFLGIWLTLLVARPDGFFRDPGSLWHIVVGEQILSTRQLPRADSFSFTCPGQPWTDTFWLSECLQALLHRLGGLDSVLLATVTLLAGLYTWAAWRLMRAGMHPLLAVLFAALSIAASSFHFHPRPHLLSILFLGLVFAKLCDFETGRASLRSLFWLVPLFAVWVNVHGGALGGMGTLGLTACGWALLALAGRRSPLTRSRQVVTLAALVVACGLTAFVNPYGLDLPRSWFAVLGSPVVAQHIQEHAPLLQSGPEGAWVGLFGVVYGAALVGVLPGRPRVTWLVPLVWFALTWTRIRHGPLFAITAVVALADMFPEIRWARWLGRHGVETFRVRPSQAEAAGAGTGWRPILLPASLVLLALILQGSGQTVPVLGRGWARVKVEESPAELLAELQRHQWERPGGTPIFNDMEFGGFLIYHTPGYRVFIDDRCELYGDERLLRYAEVMLRAPAVIDRWSEEYGFELALVKPGTAVERYLREAPGWALVREAAGAGLYRRKDPAGVGGAEDGRRASATVREGR